MTDRDDQTRDSDQSKPGEVSGQIMEGRLWAPWRMKYIEAAAAGDEPDCFLCENQTMDDDQDNLILHRGEHCFVIMNLYPYNNGHLMIAPFRHIGDYLELSHDEMAEACTFTKLCIEALHETMHPHGFNVGLNLGRAAGAGVEEHIHWHIVPRWNGDTNFMPVVGDTKVVSESLHDGYRRLREAFESKK